MTPKEKAINLIKQFRNVEWIEEDREIIKVKWLQGDEAKQCALIAVDEIIKAVNDPDDTFLSKDGIDYWENVKKEIEKL